MEYREDSVVHLKGLDPVKKRPGMYIGNTNVEGLHQLVYELIDNAVDEALAGYAKEIVVELYEPEMKIIVYDNGRGIPIGIHPKEKISTLELVLTRLHAGAKFDQRAYKTSGGLHGVGLSVVNALSEYLKADVLRDSKRVIQEYKQGEKINEFEEEVQTNESYTKIEFIPDFNIFEAKKFDPEKIKNRLKELAYLTPKVRFRFRHYKANILNDERLFYSENGLIDFIKELYSKNDIDIYIDPFYFEIKKDNYELKLCIITTNILEEKILSYVNNIKTIDGGSHVSLYKNALSRSLRTILEARKIKVDSNTLEEMKKFFQAIIDLRMPDPLFESQTKVKLKSTEIQRIFLSDLVKMFSGWLEKNSKILFEILEKAQEASRLKKKLKDQIQKLKKKTQSVKEKLPLKLADCFSKDISKRELFIVEGDSAGGSLKKCKDDEFQAVLPLRGKIRNVERCDLETIIQNQELISIASAIGLTISENNDEIDLNKLRYNKIIIMTDADADGYHIRTLLLAFFYNIFPQLIREKKVYIVEPPLYRIKYRNQSIYIKDDHELNEKLKELKNKGINKYVIQRFKGLGEMNPEELYETCVKPENRQLTLVTIEDAEIAKSIIEKLFGNNADLRKEFIKEYSRDLSYDELYE